MESCSKLNHSAAYVVAAVDNFEPLTLPTQSKQCKKRQPKKKRSLEGCEIRSKRLRPYHSYEYRSILNTEIQHAACKSTQKDLPQLHASQIGLSIWSADEKNAFFEALASVGRDSVEEIARRIGTKSQLEVQEYISVLSSGIKQLNPDSALLPIFKIPFATEISNKCCAILEVSSDAISANQECAEVEIEKEKWGNIWLITSDICRQLDTRKKFVHEAESIKKKLPGANIFNLKIWLELSQRIFMNSASPEGDNWHKLAEAGETPAIRATAVEDFYNLMASVTKRLVSATIFCATSRMKANNQNNLKPTEINSNDVRAAIHTLGLKEDSFRFWMKCARKHKLSIVDNTRKINNFNEDDSPHPRLTYDEVEELMGADILIHKNHPFYVPTRSNFILENSDSEENTSFRCSPHPKNEDSDCTLWSNDDESVASISSSKSLRREEMRRILREEKVRAAEQAQDAYTEMIDMQASLSDERMLWNVIKKDIPDELRFETEPSVKMPKYFRDTGGGNDWRDYLEYYSEWETLDNLVTSENREDGTYNPKHIQQPRTNINHQILESIPSEHYNYDDTESLSNDNIDPELITAQNKIYSDDATEDESPSSNVSVCSENLMTEIRGLAENFDLSSDRSQLSD
ncbi:hypothetical protein BGHDH14_bghG000183000001001 [Blumeria hordei DH14]|uniref:SANT domain-containing protein n=1 Tax=Blumeria graminis f. sp. hordei (strain DH14) TaxID=546991 RepID=N1J503_BLUG1|nr:hypothetical protein BGHDH14_bghG000183000001001 [Blumeria hordei DH14]